jgi:2-polyprenyl-3-methyl-5-hydroxy-6-metoxy-1,4-benzoquinol methylase
MRDDMSAALNPMPSNSTSHDAETAISSMLAGFSSNKWLTETCWPENEERVRLMIDDIAARYPPSQAVNILDVGCFVGHISLVFAGLGYRVTATDVCELEDRQPRLEQAGVEFFYSNLNELKALRKLEDASFDVVIMGEVIEHVLNHPLGLMLEVGRVLRKGGLLVMTTPNPATLINALRLVFDRSSLWGTQDFMELPKVRDNQIISKGDIHYREYRTAEVTQLLRSAGFDIEKIKYMGMGISKAQPAIKRILKRNWIVKVLMSRRPFACTHYFVARKADVHIQPAV